MDEKKEEGGEAERDEERGVQVVYVDAELD